MDAIDAGSMCDSIDPLLHRDGVPRALKEMRNFLKFRGAFDRRPGWAKANLEAIPCKRFIGGRAYKDSDQNLHIVVVGDDGKIYHSTDGGATWVEAVMYDEVLWDGTYQAQFAEYGDDLFIALGAVTGAAQNLRFDGILGCVFGVSLAGPATGVTAAAAGDGNILDGVFDYLVTLYDAVTGWESDASPETQITLARAVAPAFALTAAEGVAGALAAGTYRYQFTFYDTVNAVESAASTMRSITTTGATRVELSDILTCAEAGTWYRRIYRQDAPGGAYRLLTTLTDNTTTTYTDNTATLATAVYEYQGRQIALAALPTYGGLGRTIHRKIYRQDDGNGYTHLATIADNTTLTYTDNLATAPGDPYVQQPPVPPCTSVAVLPDGVAVWGNDVENGEPSRLYVCQAGYPEAIALSLIQSAGTDDDPLVGLYSVRDGVIALKRRGVYYINRQCSTCERVIQRFGCVSWATVQNIGSRVAWLSAEGPVVTQHFTDDDVAFIGPDPLHFCLAETWSKVQKDRLKYASSVHYPTEGIIIWFVQMCHPPAGVIADYEQHNDTGIVWYYGSNHPGGDVWLVDLMVDHGFNVPMSGSDADEAWGAFPLGYVGNMFDGQHGDGVDELIYVEVLSADGVNITIGGTNLKTGAALDLSGEGWRGSVFHPIRGAATRRCRDVLVCDRPNALIVDHSQGSGEATRVLRTAVDLGVDATTRAWIGGFAPRLHVQLDTGDPDMGKYYPNLSIQMKGT